MTSHLIRRTIRLSYSQILRLDRCPQAWHMRHVRGLVPLRRRRPPPVWGDAYHAAAAEVWRRRARFEALGQDWRDDVDGGTYNTAHEVGRVAAVARLRELDVPGLNVEALAAEVSQAAVEVCRWVGPEWRVLWLDGEPVVERHLVTPVGEVVEQMRGGHGGEWSDDFACVPVEVVTVLDLALVHRDGRVRVVDHKTTTDWPERVGDALRPDEELALDLRDDLQVRLYVWALEAALAASCARCGGGGITTPDGAAPWPRTGPGVACDCTRIGRVEGAHLVRRAAVGREPQRTRGGRGPFSVAKENETTYEQWMMVLAREHEDPERYKEAIACSRLLRWQAWAPVDHTPRSLDAARREVLHAAEDVARFRDRDPEDVPRRRKPGRWYPERPQRWSGSAPKSGAECFAWDACAACDHRELCVAEGRGDDAQAALVRLAEFSHVAEEREARAQGLAPACEFDANEVE